MIFMFMVLLLLLVFFGLMICNSVNGKIIFVGVLIGGIEVIKDFFIGFFVDCLFVLIV